MVIGPIARDTSLSADTLRAEVRTVLLEDSLARLSKAGGRRPKANKKLAHYLIYTDLHTHTSCEYPQCCIEAKPSYHNHNHKHNPDHVISRMHIYMRTLHMYALAFVCMLDVVRTVHAFVVQRKRITVGRRNSMIADPIPRSHDRQLKQERARRPVPSPTSHSRTRRWMVITSPLFLRGSIRTR